MKFLVNLKCIVGKLFLKKYCLYLYCNSLCKIDEFWVFFLVNDFGINLYL